MTRKFWTYETKRLIKYLQKAIQFGLECYVYYPQKRKTMLQLKV